MPRGRFGGWRCHVADEGAERRTAWAATQVKHVAGLKLAKRRAFETLEQLSIFSKACDAGEREALLAELNAAVKEIQAEREARGHSLWHKAQAVIPFASAVKLLST